MSSTCTACSNSRDRGRIWPSISWREHWPGQAAVGPHLPGHRHHRVLHRPRPSASTNSNCKTRSATPSREATTKGYLRQNSVDSLTGRNSGTNLGPGSPVFHWHQHRQDTVDVRLILKGGGCENMSAQYSLPTTLAVRQTGRPRPRRASMRCILDAVWQAQGKGCGPGFLGVCIGGDRASGYEFAKEQLLRDLDDANPDPELADLEARILDEANRLNIGPMGFGGKLTVGGCKIGARNRLPASFFV